jgi:hypothetical protein
MLLQANLPKAPIMETEAGSEMTFFEAEVEGDGTLR